MHSLLLYFRIFTILGVLYPLHLKANSEASPGKTLFIAGDSTAASYTSGKQQGWAAMLQPMLDASLVKVENHAQPGKSSRTYLTEGYWGKLIAAVKSGDIVVIQFGHNDASNINDDRRARGTLPGIDNQSTHIDNLLTKQREKVYTFGHYIKRMVAEVRAKDATPILLGLTVRNIWEKGRIERAFGQYSFWSYQLAWELNTPYIDFSNLMADKFEALGQKNVAALYPQDHTHFNEEAAQLYAETFISSLKGMDLNIDDRYFSELGKSIQPDKWTFLRLPMVSDQSLPSLFIVGDSTVRNGRGDGINGEWGWGDFVGEHIDSSKLNIVNRAIGGFSSRSYINGGQWESSLSMMRPGDYVLIQFGHNDSKAINDAKRPRGTLPGSDNKAVDIFNLLTKKDETVRTYGWYLRKMVGDALSRGITPILCSPVPRKLWNDNNTHIVRPKDSYAKWAEDVATDSNIAFIDLYQLIANEYDKLGVKKVDKLFADKHTHTNAKGARINAKIVAKQLKSIIEI